MAKQVINPGTVANDGTGDTARASMIKANDNFTELYNGKNINDATQKATPVDADKIGILDSTASFIIKYFTWLNLKTALDSIYAGIGTILSLGSTSSTAHRGDHGASAYTHSQLTSGNPHNVTKTEVGLSNVPNVDATNPANITQTSSYRFATDAEKAAWNAMIGGSIFQTTWNANTNSPSLASGVGTKGYYYIVTTLGATSLDGISDWKVGDWAIFDGTVWRKVDNTDAVASVNGITGAVVLGTDDVNEGVTNLYFTNARALAAAPAETATTIAALINAAGAATPNNSDLIATALSGGTLKQISWTNAKAFLKTYFDTIYQAVSSVLTAFAALSPTNDDFLQYKSGAWANRTIAQVKTDLLSVAYNVHLFNDYINTTADAAWNSAVTGTSASFAIVGASNTNQFGIAQFSCGTSNTAKGFLGLSTLACFIAGVGRIFYGCRFKFLQLSSGTERYQQWIGLIDSNTGESTDGIYFRYSDNVNSGKWECVTRSNTTETATDSGITASTTQFDRFEIIVNAAGTSVTFYINGSSVATITTNIPTAGNRNFGCGVLYLKSVGTTSTAIFHCDYQDVIVEFTTQR